MGHDPARRTDNAEQCRSEGSEGCNLKGLHEHRSGKWAVRLMAWHGMVQSYFSPKYH